jgi:hypothetical protein
MSLNTNTCRPDGEKLSTRELSDYWPYVQCALISYRSKHDKAAKAGVISAKRKRKVG